MEYGGFWVRVVAYLIDGLILFFAQWAIYTAFGVNMFGLDATDPTAVNPFATGAGTAAYSIATIGGILYFVLMESSAKQATVGKMALGLIVTDAQGRRITFLRALGRYFAKILSAIILLIGFIMVAFTERKQGLHDMIASTLVIKGQPGTAGLDTGVFE